jgi:hypothetical protein
MRGLPLVEAVHFGMIAGAAAVLGSGIQLCRFSDFEPSPQYRRR